MNLSELNNLDFSEPGSWPFWVKFSAVLLACGAILVAAYFFDTQGQRQSLHSARTQENSLKEQFKKKQHKAANLEKYLQQMQDIEESFGTLLRQLPGKTEVAGLLEDISQTGLAAGLEFELFKPESETPRDFYAELPIKMRVLGTYHEFGRFISDVAALPRIVTVHDFNIQPLKAAGEEQGKQDKILLSMDVTAKTYRYLDEEEGK